MAERLLPAGNRGGSEAGGVVSPCVSPNNLPRMNTSHTSRFFLRASCSQLNHPPPVASPPPSPRHLHERLCDALPAQGRKCATARGAALLPPAVHGVRVEEENRTRKFLLCSAARTRVGDGVEQSSDTFEVHGTRETGASGEETACARRAGSQTVH